MPQAARAAAPTSQAKPAPVAGPVGPNAGGPTAGGPNAGGPSAGGPNAGGLNAGGSTTGENRVTELRVSGHLMTLEPGLFCVFQAPGPTAAADGSGLPGVRISLPPGPISRPEAITISGFRDDGWLTQDAAALVRVSGSAAQILVTVYQSPKHSAEHAPRLQVLRLNGAPAGGQAQRLAAPEATTETPEVVAHIQRAGDVGAAIGAWLGTRGSGQWIEGFGVAPHGGVAPEDIEYQAVLGRGWLSPWVEGGKFCGSRGMALPLLGIKVRLKGEAAQDYLCYYSATFIDGTAVGPVAAGEVCEAESLAALEAIQIELRPRQGHAASATNPRSSAGASSRRTATSVPVQPAGKPVRGAR